jgi:hypothetical protein
MRGLVMILRLPAARRASFFSVRPELELEVPNAGLEGVDLVEELQRQGGTRKVQLEIPLQADGAARPADLGAAEAPLVRALAEGTQQALVDHEPNGLIAGPAYRRELREGDAQGFV